MQRCTVQRITNLATHTDPLKGKSFQTFIAGGVRLVTGEHYVDGQMGVVIPSGAIVPDNILEEMWLKDRLSGKHRNIVKSKPMFGYPSEGIFYGKTFTDNDNVLKKSLLWNDNWQVGDDVTDELGITFKC